MSGERICRCGHPPRAHKVNQQSGNMFGLDECKEPGCDCSAYVLDSLSDVGGDWEAPEYPVQLRRCESCGEHAAIGKLNPPERNVAWICGWCAPSYSAFALRPRGEAKVWQEQLDEWLIEREIAQSEIAENGADFPQTQNANPQLQSEEQDQRSAALTIDGPYTYGPVAVVRASTSAQFERALRRLVSRVEELWPYLRVPEKMERRPPASIGTALRREAEEARKVVPE